MKQALLSHAINGAIDTLQLVCSINKAINSKSKRQNKVHAKRKDIVMKKSTLIAWVAFFSAIAGALAAAYYYIQRREKELDEYEQLLFSEDFNEETPDDFDSFDEVEKLDRIDETEE